MEFLSQGYFYQILAIAFLGTISHFLKKKIKGETLTAIGSYFKDNIKSTLLAVIATIVGTVAYYTQVATGCSLSAFH
jgi:hypothetical protein